MTWSARFFRSRTAYSIAREIIVWYIRFVYLTSRFDLAGQEARDALKAQGRPFLIALWHNRIAMMPYAWKEETRALTVLASAHRDGRLVSEGLGRFGFSAVPVDSRRGGSGPTREILRLLKQGKCVGITPDGPRGPRMRLRGGMITIAAMAQVPIVPVAYSATRRRLLGSWDRFILPLPFSRLVCLWGDPIDPPPRGDADAFERVRELVERRMTDLSDECDRRCGVSPIPPADPPPSSETQPPAPPASGASYEGGR
ncbi:MAG: lysophospholipid acyltransferase family protein [Marivibrio sp.]|uniref:lysophospholipid acyltransferase family protein n=1 Tax=Marivibrio sp. TaxID=2039719 RepID=UPI0032ECAE00